jgi:hypothetical protein
MPANHEGPQYVNSPNYLLLPVPCVHTFAEPRLVIYVARVNDLVFRPKSIQNQKSKTVLELCVISGFRHSVNEISALLEFYTV